MCLIRELSWHITHGQRVWNQGSLSKKWSFSVSKCDFYWVSRIWWESMLFDDHGAIIFRKFPLLFVGIFLLKVLHHAHVGASKNLGTLMCLLKFQKYLKLLPLVFLPLWFHTLPHVFKKKILNRCIICVRMF